MSNLPADPAPAPFGTKSSTIPAPPRLLDREWTPHVPGEPRAPRPSSASVPTGASQPGVVGPGAAGSAPRQPSPRSRHRPESETRDLLERSARLLHEAELSLAREQLAANCDELNYFADRLLANTPTTEAWRVAYRYVVAREALAEIAAHMAVPRLHVQNLPLSAMKAWAAAHPGDSNDLESRAARAEQEREERRRAKPIQRAANERLVARRRAERLVEDRGKLTDAEEDNG